MDGSNLALSLLGLPPIPGSLVVPVLKNTTDSLRAARNGNLMTVFWYDPNGSFALDASTEIGAASQWQEVTNGIVVNETTHSFTITNAPANKFFRLRKR